MTIRYISIVFTEEEDDDDDDLLYGLEFAFNDDDDDLILCDFSLFLLVLDIL